MYANWTEYINQFKSIIFPDRRSLNKLRLAIDQEQIELFWEKCTLAQMENILSISNQYILNFIVSQLLQPYLSSRKVTHEAFIVSRLDSNHEEHSLMYVYDCRIFRSNLYTKEQNDFLSSFVLCYRENIEISSPVFEIVNCNQLPVNRWVLKVKESALLRVFTYIKETMRKVRHKTDKIVIPQIKYLQFMQEWLKCFYNYNIDTTVNYFFKAILSLLDNQILLHYFYTLTPKQKYERMYERPIKMIEKLKNVEQFTLTEGIAETETKWQTLKITAYRLKYRIEQLSQKLQCYRMEQTEQEEPSLQLNDEDQLIMNAFSKLKQLEDEYQTLYQ